MSDEQKQLRALKRELRSVDHGQDLWAVMSIILLFAFFPWSLLFGGVLSRDSAWRAQRAAILKAEIARLEAFINAPPDVRAVETLKAEEQRMAQEAQVYCTVCRQTFTARCPLPDGDLRALAPCWSCGTQGGLVPLNEVRFAS